MLGNWRQKKSSQEITVLVCKISCYTKVKWNCFTDTVTRQDFLCVFPWKSFIPGFNGLSIQSVISSLNIKHFLIMYFCMLILDGQVQRGEMCFLSLVNLSLIHTTVWLYASKHRENILFKWCTLPCIKKNSRPSWLLGRWVQGALYVWMWQHYALSFCTHF